MNRSWVRFPQAAQIRPPGSGWAFLYARVVLLVAPRVFRAPEAPAAREARRPHFVRRRASKPARALRFLRRPPHLWGRAAVCAGGRRPAREIATHEPAARSGRSRGPPWPRRRPRAPQPGPPIPPGPFTPVAPGVLACGLARRLEARPGPAAAHGHRSLAPVPRAPSTPVGLGCCCVAWRVGSKPGRAPPPPTGTAAGFSGPPMRFGLSCWDFGALRCVLLQTSSIGGVFRVDF